tara:strand:- start:79430 stop:80275 length:846 start_codon:yes stop_codon:yes gene_type:complete
MRGNIKKLHITVGLPASGKTTWAKKFSRTKKRGYYGSSMPHIELDYYKKFRGSPKDTMTVLKERVTGSSEESIVDGLFLTEDDVIKALLFLINQNKIAIKEVVIHYWKPNREYSLWNDLYRREVDSVITIENGVMDDFDNVFGLKAKLPSIDFSIERHDVVKAEAYRLFASKHNITLNEGGEVQGESWCTGGTWNDCWENTGNVPSDPSPEGMSVLDDLLETICPSVSFLQYKRIMNDCVYVEDFSDGDYYGGTTYHNKYVLRMGALYNYLVEAKLIDEIL